MGFWSFIRRKVHETPSKPPEDDIRASMARMTEAVHALESEHRKDRLELLDMHERVKTSLAKMARRARDVSPDTEEVQGTETAPAPARVPSLLSRRGKL